MSDKDLFDNRDDLFGEDGDEFGFDDVNESDLGDFDVDSPEFGEEEAFGEGEAAGGERRGLFGLNRRFVLIAGIFGVIICVAVIALAAILLSNRGPSDIDLTVTAVYATNTFVAYALDLTETQNAVYAQNTATADAWTDTPTPTPTFTATPSPTEVLATPTQQIIFVTPTPDGQGGGINADAVAMTATALAQILAGGTPTPEVVAGGGTPIVDGQGGGFVTPTPQTSLPTTGLFDDIGSGGGVNTLATAGLAALGLAGIIFLARRLRR